MKHKFLIFKEEYLNGNKEEEIMNLNYHNIKVILTILKIN